MSGTLIQLVSYGAENIPINYNPEITFFKTVFKRYYNFAMESVYQPIHDSVDFDKEININLSKKGDLLSKVYLEVTLPHSNENNSYWTNRIGFNLIKKIEVYIGNQLFDRQYGQWMHIHNNINESVETNTIIDKIVGGNRLLSNQSQNIIIPFYFSFCKHYQNSIPLCALIHQEVKFKIFFNSKINCHQNGTIPTGGLTNAKLWCDFIYIDDELKKNIVQNKTNYLYESVERYQKNINKNFIKNISLPFTLPSKEIIFVIKSNDNTNDKFTSFKSINNLNLVKKAQFKIENTNVLSDGFKDGNYFNKIIPFKYHNGNIDTGINILSFSLKPNDLEPSGYLFFKELKKPTLFVESLEDGMIHIYSVGYNIITFEKGYISKKYIY